MRKYFRWIVVGVVILIGLAAVSVMLATRAAEPMPQALAAMQSDSQVDVSNNSWLVFKPHATDPTTGFIFYPGGLVDARAYAPMAHDIAAQGYLVVIVPMPLNMAFFDANRASDVIAKYPSIKRWAIGGHSLGGVAAAMFVKSHPGATQGIAFWASYPADSMVDSRVTALSIYGTNDGAVDQLVRARNLMPALTKWVVIEGGNHGQFGWYGLQSGDGTATISRETQQEQIVNATIELLNQLSK